MTSKSFLKHKISQNSSKKGLGRIFAPYRHALRVWTKIQNFTIFTSEPATQILRCAVWVHILTLSPFFENFWIFQKRWNIFHTLITFEWRKLAEFCWLEKSQNVQVLFFSLTKIPISGRLSRNDLQALVCPTNLLSLKPLKNLDLSVRGCSSIT